MTVPAATGIRGIVFDLDGTLYVCRRYAVAIHDCAAAYIAELKQISQAEAGLLMVATRLKRVEESGLAQTLSAICCELGGTIQGLHRFFEHNLQPEQFLERDERVVALLKILAEQYSLHLYTNNNAPLTARIMTLLGLDSMMSSTHTIDETWRGKPDEEMVRRVLGLCGLLPGEALFVGDRYDIDLRVPEQLGCPVYLSQTLEQLLRLEELLTVTPLPLSGTPAVPENPPAVRP